MTLDNVLSKIINDAEMEANARIEEGEREAELILGEAQRETEIIRKKKEQEEQDAIKDLERLQKSKIRMKYRRRRFEAEKMLIDMCWADVKEKIGSIDPELNRVLLNKLLHLAKATPAFSIRSVVAHEDGDEARPYSVYCRERDMGIVSQLSNLELAEPIECIGGVMAEDEDSNWRINLTYDILLDEIEENMLGKVYDILVGD